VSNKFISLALLLVASIVNADDKLKVPDFSIYKKEGYPFKFHHFYDDKKHTITYGFTYIRDNTEWIGMCKSSNVKGLDSVGCNIFSEPMNFTIFVADGRKDLFFDYASTIDKKDWRHEVNFRLNGGEIETIPVNFIPDPMGAKVIINDISSRSKLEYSIKSKNGYLSYKYNLMGLKQAIEFAENVIKENR
jgi:hypothetical protein